VRILGVIDLAGGYAVHAVAGRRRHYQPVRQVGSTRIDAGDPIAVASAYREQFAIDELYVADLDAIAGGRPQEHVVATLGQAASLWLDAGITTVAAAHRAVNDGAARAVVGLETLSSFDALGAICAAIGGSRTVFSLDLLDGRPLHRLEGLAPDTSPAAVAALAANTGATSIIAIDLARVGTDAGADMRLLRQLRGDIRGVALIAGGGIRHLEDLQHLAAIGCDGAVLASALHDGRITATDLAAARHFQPSVSR
jgi:phosphoribosylformimino-5-aminoimidazole carboxamide ribotide isomerase